MLGAAKAEGETWYAAVCLAGESGLRVGEVKALRWREDVDMVARSITVNQQTCEGETTTPKGHTRRKIPMTSTVYEALKGLSAVPEGLVVRGLDGKAKPDGETDHIIARICRRAGLPVHYWHTLRHSFATHAALAGVNPWHLMKWLGHKRIDETMLHVNIAEHHGRELPEALREAAKGDHDPEARIIRLLGAGARPQQPSRDPRARSDGQPSLAGLTQGSRRREANRVDRASLAACWRFSRPTWLRRRASNCPKSSILTSTCPVLQDLCTGWFRPIPLSERSVAASWQRHRHCPNHQLAEPHVATALEREVEHRRRQGHRGRKRCVSTSLRQRRLEFSEQSPRMPSQAG